jgi:S1-C subfamily serine protease
VSFEAVVRIFATAQAPDYDSPWQAESPSASTGSGVIIAPGHVLTGAHVVADATFLQVQRLDTPDKGVARVRAICHDADLALLEMDDHAFTEGIQPPAVGELPQLGDEVAVVGFPIGGEEVSITEGVVSRIEVQKYSHSQRRLLAVTVDAAINEGNSGGPVFLEDDVVGIAFQKIGDADNIGELVPAPLVKRFLDSVGKDRFVHVPALGLSTQRLESPLLRRHIGVPDGESGVLVSTVNFGSSGWGVFEAGDAILAIDGYEIANNGTIRYRDRHRTTFAVVLGDHAVGDRISARRLRDGVIEDVEIELKAFIALVPDSAWDHKPTYCVWGGLVLQPLSRDYLATWDDWWDKAPSELLHHYYQGVRQDGVREVVVLSRVLADELTLGFEDHYQETVTHLGDEAIPSLRWLTERLDAATGVVELRTSKGAKLVVDAVLAKDRHAQILARYHIPRDRSLDLPERPW